MKFGIATKNPVDINYFHWTDPKHIKSLSAWVRSFGDEPLEHLIFEDNNLKVKTLEGTSYNVPKDYIIIRGVKGEYYPCELQIFEQTYTYQK